MPNMRSLTGAGTSAHGFTHGRNTVCGSGQGRETGWDPAGRSRRVGGECRKLDASRIACFPAQGNGILSTTPRRSIVNRLGHLLGLGELLAERLEPLAAQDRPEVRVAVAPPPQVVFRRQFF